MQSKQQFCNLIFRIISRAATAALAMATVFALTVALTQSAQAQTLTVLHNFTGKGDGSYPEAGLTMDQAGNFYGTTTAGGGSGNGTVFRLSKKGSGWILTPLYAFAGGNDGAYPEAGLIFGADGSLYGTTSSGGGSNAGTVFSLKPYPSACKTALCGWQETVLYRFAGGSDGANPELGNLIFDQAGDLYGTTTGGGAYGSGTVFELVPSQGGWTEKVLYSFTGGSDGGEPLAGLIFDNVGNLYSTTYGGGNLACFAPYGCGTVFQLTPSGSGWTESVLYAFQYGNDGGFPFAGLIFDQAGNLYGTTAFGGTGNGGTAFELTPAKGMGPWTYTLVYGFTGGGSDGPAGTLVMDAAGNLYGTTVADNPNQWGSVFKLTPSNGGWTYTSLYDFDGGSNGGGPWGNVTFDANGNLYGTAENGGSSQNCSGGCGVVWEITP